MGFNSLLFLCLLPIVMLVYWVLPHKYRPIMLLIVSYAFYMSQSPWLIFLILFTTLISFMCGLFMDALKSVAARRACLIATLVCCLGVLFFFKYFTFSVNTVIDLINVSGANVPDFAFELMLPVGISFYTFQTLSYAIDIYRGRIKSERNLLIYALYVTYFPQLVAGPIERPENLIPQLKTERKFCSEDFSLGLKITLIGYVKKIVIADGVAAIVNGVYNNPGAANGLTVLIATVLFAVQIYCDFSGYTDIAIGIARMMGIKLMQNFDKPYSATSIRGFWRRWHISLTCWFTDYVYIPLGGSRVKPIRWAANVMVVFLLSGLWHGAALNFVVWGGLHGAYQIIGKLKDGALKRLERRGVRLARGAWTDTVKRAITFALVCFAWIFFRGNSLSDCGMLITKLFTDYGGTGAALAAINCDGITLITAALMCGLLAVCNKLNESEFSDGVGSRAISVSVVKSVAYVILAVTIAVAWSALISSGGESSFIYFRF